MARTWLGFLAVCLVAVVAGTSRPAAATRRECAPGEAHTTFERFVAAFNAGNRPALERLVAPTSTFMWFSVSGAGRRLGDRSKDRATLARYFENRHTLRDQFRDITWRGNGSSNGYANFQFVLTRMADDELPSRYEGKGAVSCTGGSDSIAVWSMARRTTLRVTAHPARLPAVGWHVGSARVTGCKGCVQTESWA